MTDKTDTKTQTLITAKEAGVIAKTYYEEISSDDQHRLTLEEVELSEDNKDWLITLGIYSPTDSLMLLSQGIKESLNYKVFTINRITGEVTSMKMRLYPLANINK